MRQKMNLHSAAEGEQKEVQLADLIETALREAELSFRRVEDAFELLVATGVKTYNVRVLAIDGEDEPHHFAIIVPDLLGARLPDDHVRRLKVLENAALRLGCEFVAEKLCVWQERHLALLIHVPLGHVEPATDLIKLELALAIEASDRAFASLAPVMWGSGQPSTVQEKLGATRPVRKRVAGPHPVDPVVSANAD